MSPGERALLVSNIAGAMRMVPREIQMRQIAHFYRADHHYGAGTAA